jgi:ribokinase
MTTAGAGQRGRVCVIASINVDLVMRLPRLPAVGQTVLGGELTRQDGGKGANQAVAAARAGADVRLIGAVGHQDGDRPLAALASESVDVSAVARVSAPTGLAVVLVEDGTGENQIAVASGANALVSAAHVTSSLGALHLVPADVVVLSFELPESALEAAVLAAAASGARLLVNPAPAHARYAGLLAGAITTPNAGELAALTGIGPTDAGLAGAERAGAQRAGAELAGAELAGAELTGSALASVSAGAVALAQRTGAPVLATLGARGAVLAEVSPAEEGACSTEYFSSYRVEARDTTGAGDTLTGVLAAGLAAGSGLRDSISRAMAAAALAVTRDGARTAMPTAAEIDQFLRAVP